MMKCFQHMQLINGFNSKSNRKAGGLCKLYWFGNHLNPVLAGLSHRVKIVDEAKKWTSWTSLVLALQNTDHTFDKQINAVATVSFFYPRQKAKPSLSFAKKANHAWKRRHWTCSSVWGCFTFHTRGFFSSKRFFKLLRLPWPGWLRA